VSRTVVMRRELMIRKVESAIDVMPTGNSREEKARKSKSSQKIPEIWL